MDNPESREAEWRSAYRERLGARIRAARGKARQEDVRDRLHALGLPLSISAISEVERGIRRVAAEELLAIALALDVAPGVLLADHGDEPVTVGDVSMTSTRALQWVRGAVTPPGASLFAEYRYLYVNQPAARKAELDRAMSKLKKQGGFPDKMHGVIEPDDTTGRRALAAMMNVEFVTHGTMFGRPAASSGSQDELRAYMGWPSDGQEED